MDVQEVHFSNTMILLHLCAMCTDIIIKNTLNNANCIFCNDIKGLVIIYGRGVGRIWGPYRFLDFLRGAR